MCQTIRFLQAYQNSIRHSTTTARFHYSQTMDITNIANTEAIRFFPYEVFPVDLTNDLQQQLQNDPGSLLASYQGLQPRIHQAMQDHNIDPADYGKGARGKERNKGSKGFGKPSSKGKRIHRPPRVEESNAKTTSGSRIGSNSMPERAAMTKVPR